MNVQRLHEHITGRHNLWNKNTHFFNDNQYLSAYECIHAYLLITKLKKVCQWPYKVYLCSDTCAYVTLFHIFILGWYSSKSLISSKSRKSSSNGGYFFVIFV
jgi:hypothetical protein